MEEMTAIFDSLVEFRSSNDKNLRKNYKKAFKKAHLFLVKRNEGQKREFIPFDLAGQFAGENKKKLKSTFKKEYGKPIRDKQLLSELLAFCRRHGLPKEQFQSSNADDILFFIEHKEKEKKAKVIPISKAEPFEREHFPPFFDVREMRLYTGHAGNRYQAADAHLRKIGSGISQSIVAPTNHWLQLTCPAGFVTERERYWQVAGVFKDFSWGKILKPGNRDKRVFFSLGVDFKSESLFYRLDCLRSGSAKLPEDKIHKFDYFTKGLPLDFRIPFDQMAHLSWPMLVRQARQFILEQEKVYDHVIDFIWGGHVSKSQNNKLLEVGPDTITANPSPWLSRPKDMKAGIALVITHEKDMLTLAGKPHLAQQVTRKENSGTTNAYYDINSFHSDGSSKPIIVKVNRADNSTGFIIREEEVRQSQGERSRTHLYIVHDFDKKNNSAKVLKVKGDFRKVLSLNPISYQAGIK